jgi:hypothetical protein
MLGAYGVLAERDSRTLLDVRFAGAYGVLAERDSRTPLDVGFPGAYAVRSPSGGFS